MGSISKYIERLRYYCEEVSVGYDWARRWDVHDGGDSDCSSLTIVCLNEAGFDTGDAVTTHRRRGLWLGRPGCSGIYG